MQATTETRETRELYQYQQQAATILRETSKHLFVVAPTGAGKTDVGFLGLERGGWGIYVAPTRALCLEKANWLRERFPDMKVVVGNKDYALSLQGFRGSHIRVLTPWKLAVILHNDSNFAERCRVVVIDEIQKLDPNVELVITKLIQFHPGIRIIALAPAIHEDDEPKLAAWLNAVVVKSEERPVPLVTRIAHFDLELDDEGEEYTFLSLIENGRQYSGRSGWLKGGMIPASRVLAVLQEIRGDGDDSPALVYTPYRERARKIVEELTRDHCSDWDESLQAIADSLPADAGDFTETIKTALPVGIGLHHGGSTTQEAELVYRLALEGKLQAVVTCQTLATGINIPFRHVIVESVYVEPERGDERRLMSVSDFWNVAGRAGRPQFDTIGYCWVITTSEIELVEVEEVLLKQKASRIESRIYDEYFLTSQIAQLIQLGRSTAAKLVGFLRATYFGRTLQDQQPLVDQLERVIAKLVDDRFVQVMGKFLVLTDRGQRLARLGMHPAEYATIEHLVGTDNCEYEDWVRALAGVCGEHALRGKRKPTEEEIDGVVAYGMTAHALRTPWATRELADYLSRLLELSFSFMQFNKVNDEFQRRWRRDIADRFLFGQIEFARKLARVLPRPAVRRVIRNFGPSLNRMDPATGETLPLDETRLTMLAKIIWSQVDPKPGEVARVAGIIGVAEAHFRRIVAEVIGRKEKVNV